MTVHLTFVKMQLQNLACICGIVAMILKFLKMAQQGPY